jgi:dTDP-4-dehydrorhamnose 3,5-epimerase
VETEVAGTFVVEIEPIDDERGFFARTFCADEFRARGLEACVVQCNISYNKRRGTLRGMHYQAAPHEEAKLVRCVRGAAIDVALDLRPSSPAYRRWTAVELSAENRRALYIPKGVAHGFQTLTDDTELYYEMSERFVPGAGRGVRWNDPAFGIEWPIAEPIVSARDAAYPDFDGVSD